MTTQILAPMPGKINEVNVTVGSQVSINETLVVLESMKMEVNIAAPRDGKVVSIHVAAGASIEKGELLVLID